MVFRGGAGGAPNVAVLEDGDREVRTKVGARKECADCGRVGELEILLRLSTVKNGPGQEQRWTRKGAQRQTAYRV